jgi:hypothetical protein
MISSGHHLFKTGHWSRETGQLAIETETEMKLVIEKK